LRDIHVSRVQVLDEVLVGLVVGGLLEFLLTEVEESRSEGAERLASHVASEFLPRAYSLAFVDPLERLSDGVLPLRSLLVRPGESSILLIPE